MLHRSLIASVCLVLLAACTGTDRFYTAPLVEVKQSVPSRYSSIEVLEVSLPTYASGEDLFLTEADGSLQTAGLLWADDPTRAVTLSLTRALTEITGARVAPAPWPFEDLAEARVDVRVERFLVVGGRFLTLNGQYFVAPLEDNGRNRARIFDLSRALPGEAGLNELLRARSAIVADLALLIARDGLR